MMIVVPDLPFFGEVEESLSCVGSGGPVDTEVDSIPVGPRAVSLPGLKVPGKPRFDVSATVGSAAVVEGSRGIVAAADVVIVVSQSAPRYPASHSHRHDPG